MCGKSRCRRTRTGFEDEGLARSSPWRMRHPRRTLRAWRPHGQLHLSATAPVRFWLLGMTQPTFRSLIWSTGEYRNHVPRLILSGFRAAEGIHGLIAEFLVWTARLRRFYGAERNMHWKYGNLSTLLLVWEGHQ